MHSKKKQPKAQAPPLELAENKSIISTGASGPITLVPSGVNQEVTPMQMLQVAVSQGADIEKLKQLMDLSERWEANRARKAFEASISMAKAEIKPIIKNQQVDYQNRNSAGRTNYMHEDMAQIANHIDPILSKFGLSYRHRATQEGKRLTITCIMAHRDGHSEETTLSGDNDESGNKNALQSVGSAATYLQRYTLKLALGLSASKDTDAATQPDEETISKEQVANMLALLTEVGANIPAFMNWAKVQSLEDIHVNNYKYLMEWIEKKRRQQ